MPLISQLTEEKQNELTEKLLGEMSNPEIVNTEDFISQVLQVPEILSNPSFTPGQDSKFVEELLKKNPLVYDNLTPTIQEQKKDVLLKIVSEQLSQYPKTKAEIRQSIEEILNDENYKKGLLLQQEREILGNSKEDENVLDQVLEQSEQINEKQVELQFFDKQDRLKELEKERGTKQDYINKVFLLASQTFPNQPFSAPTSIDSFGDMLDKCRESSDKNIVNAAERMARNIIVTRAILYHYRAQFSDLKQNKVQYTKASVSDYEVMQIPLMQVSNQKETLENIQKAAPLTTSIPQDINEQHKKNKNSRDTFFNTLVNNLAETKKLYPTIYENSYFRSHLIKKKGEKECITFFDGFYKENVQKLSTLSSQSQNTEVQQYITQLISGGDQCKYSSIALLATNLLLKETIVLLQTPPQLQDTRKYENALNAFNHTIQSESSDLRKTGAFKIIYGAATAIFGLLSYSTNSISKGIKLMTEGKEQIDKANRTPKIFPPPGQQKENTVKKETSINNDEKTSLLHKSFN